ncbi:Dabb family protein [Pelagicoccus mobilis]|uniref:Dabb family protein n=1 Tax=Pelagicoccus mobilis TaxID=415221 RepID=A0A934RYH7_9BACT|nr:Dabb family protein [Pelagicoccus mobilis]MBK1878921.1 Dabb family protein [Pelagicoccus mobilis]
MLVHTVLFNLTPGMSDEQVAAFEKDLNSLATIDVAKACYIGKVADTAKRPVVQTDWDYMLTVIVENVADHDIYQDHPTHHAFIANQKQFFGQVRVFDCE